jgi:hypothetical protein
MPFHLFGEALGTSVYEGVSMALRVMEDSHLWLSRLHETVGVIP